MRIKYTVGIFSHILFSKEKISNFKLCSYSSNETFRIVKYLSHYLKDIGFYYRHCNCISACPKWRNISLYLPSTLSHCCPPIQDWITNKQSVCFLFVFLENITFQIFFGAFAKGFFACSQLLEFGRQNDLHGNTDVNVSWDVPKSAYSTLNNWWREQNVDKAWNGALNKT